MTDDSDLSQSCKTTGHSRHVSPRGHVAVQKYAQVVNVRTASLTIISGDRNWIAWDEVLLTV